MSGDGEATAGVPAGGWKPWLAAIALSSLVLVVFLLAAVLQSDRTSPTLSDSPDAAGIYGVEVRTEAPSPPIEITQPEIASPAPLAGPETPAPALDPVAEIEQRAQRDLARAGADSEGWTVQFLVACEPSNVGRALERFGGSEDVYVFPASVGSRPCWRVCRGRFPDRVTAERVAAEASSGGERAVPRALAEISP